MQNKDLLITGLGPILPCVEYLPGKVSMLPSVCLLYLSLYAARCRLPLTPSNTCPTCSLYWIKDLGLQAKPDTAYRCYSCSLVSPIWLYTGRRHVDSNKSSLSSNWNDGLRVISQSHQQFVSRWDLKWGRPRPWTVLLCWADCVWSVCVCFLFATRHSASKGIVIAMICTFFEAFNVPVFWPILVMYFIMLFCITMKRQIKVGRRWPIRPQFKKNSSFVNPC